MAIRTPTGHRLRILQLLVAKGKMTGADMIEADESLSRSSIYTTLLRLEDDKLVTSHTKVEKRVAGPPRRYYEITALGQRLAQLGELAEAVQAGAELIPVTAGGKRR